jgi:hypothetical protein
MIIQPQIPYGYMMPYNNMNPYNQIPSLQLQNQNNILNNNIYIPNYNAYNNNLQTRMIRNNTVITPQINNLNQVNNVNNNNNLNISKQEKSRLNKTADNIMNVNNSNENDFLLISNDNDLNNKMQNEKKIEEWKNDLKKQIEEKKKEKELAKKELAQKEKEEEKKYLEYLEYKNRQAEENKKNKKNKKYQSQISNNFLEMQKTEFEKSQQTKSEEQKKSDEIQNPYDKNNPLNEYDIPPEAIKEQEKFKKYIDQTYETLGQSLGQSIQNEIIKMSTMLTDKYEPFQQSENYKRLSKLNNQNMVRKDKKMEKMQDILEERQLLDFIIGEKDVFSPFKYKNYNINKYNLNNQEIPSYFGKNKSSYERQFASLKSNSHYLYGDYSNGKNEGKEYKIIFSKEDYDNEQKNNKYTNVDNSQSRKFGRNDDNVMESIGVSQSLDNKTSFVPLNKDVDQKMIDEINKEYNNKINQNKTEEEKKEEKKMPDKIEENILKNLNEIDLLNKNVILYDIDKKLINKNNIKNNNDIFNQPPPEKSNDEKVKKDIEIIEKEKKNEKKDEENKNDKNKEKKNDEKNTTEDNNEKNTNEIGIQSEPAEIIKTDAKEESLNNKEISIKNEHKEKEDTEQKEIKNENEKDNEKENENENENEENSNEQNELNSNINIEEKEESYEESGEEEKDN